VQYFRIFGWRNSQGTPLVQSSSGGRTVTKTVKTVTRKIVNGHQAAPVIRKSSVSMSSNTMPVQMNAGSASSSSSSSMTSSVNKDISASSTVYNFPCYSFNSLCNSSTSRWTLDQRRTLASARSYRFNWRKSPASGRTATSVKTVKTVTSSGSQGTPLTNTGGSRTFTSVKTVTSGGSQGTPLVQRSSGGL
jgi:hypothetical protein